jgi:SAM-dependent methyltransferase
MHKNCPLCQGKGNIFFNEEKHTFYKCTDCKGIFRNPDQFLNLAQEKERYLHHVSNINDIGYYKFVSPIIKEVQKYFAKGKKGLDFGCGHTPVLSELLKKEQYEMEIFDAVFFNDAEVLNKKYDFIVSCEVIEHFYDPFNEFNQMQEMLVPDGKLICKTHLYDDQIEFDKWYYKNDPSHVFIYQIETMQWIKDHCHFKDVKIEQRLITFSKYA